MKSTYLVTGGAGFIGSCFVLQRVKAGDNVINLDKLTYSGNLENLDEIKNAPNHVFVRGDIGDEQLVIELLEKYQPDAVVNFAAESHVDRSILDPDVFVKTNVLGTEVLLRVVKDWWKNLEEEKRNKFRFHHISTDEVFGTLSMDDPAFTEDTPFAPNSPYSASKASSDHFVRAYHETYGLPTVITNCSNNYGPYQFPEKLIPLMINNAINHKDLPVYGDGMNVRDWLYVEDHCKAIDMVINGGKFGEVYNVGGHNERTNITIVKTILEYTKDCVDDSVSESLIKYVKDRKGHDKRYGIAPDKIRKDLGWTPETSFEVGIKKTIEWYLSNKSWMENITNGQYKEYYKKMYGDN